MKFSIYLKSAVKSTKVTSPYDCNIADWDVNLKQTNLMIDCLFIYGWKYLSMCFQVLRKYLLKVKVCIFTSTFSVLNSCSTNFFFFLKYIDLCSPFSVFCSPVPPYKILRMTFLKTKPTHHKHNTKKNY